jgi:hypothetical protein
MTGLIGQVAKPSGHMSLGKKPQPANGLPCTANENLHTPHAKADLQAQGYPLTFRRGKAGHTQRSASSTRPLRPWHSAIRATQQRNPKS